MQLICDSDELHELIVKNVIRLKLIDNKTVKVIKVFSPITNQSYEIAINTDVTTDKISISSNAYEDYDKYTINDWWKLFINSVPLTIEQKGTKWTKDNPNTGRRILRENTEGALLFKHNIEVNNIQPKVMLLAYAYDLYCHRLDSIDENKLKYMLSLDKWLSQTQRIDLLFKNACDDLTFLEKYNENPIIVEQDDTAFTPFKSLNDDKELRYEF